MKEFKTRLEVYYYILESNYKKAINRKGNIIYLNNGEQLLVHEQ